MNRRKITILINGRIISLNVSKTMFINVVMEQNGVMYCTFGWDKYSADSVRIMGHLSDEEIESFAGTIDLNI